MHTAYLDWDNFQKYFNFLKDESFIVICNNPHEHYQLTEKGEELLNKLQDIEGILSSWPTYFK